MLPRCNLDLISCSLTRLIVQEGAVSKGVLARQITRMLKNRTLCPTLASILLALALSPTLTAQVDSASLTGLITDPSAASVRGATVTAANRENGVERSTVTDDSGYYYFPSLPVGSYAITVKQNGFASQTQVVSLDPSAKARQDFHLVLGATTSTVEVQAESPQLSRDDASIGTVIENQVIEGTPLYQRNWDDLIRLVPCVQQNRYTQQSGATDAGRTGDFNAHGVHSLQKQLHARRCRQQYVLGERSGAQYIRFAPVRRCYSRI